MVDTTLRDFRSITETAPDNGRPVSASATISVPADKAVKSALVAWRQPWFVT
jgi:hypothetical protein